MSLQNYNRRYWEGEPNTREGVTHAAAPDQIDNEPVAACGRLVQQEDDYWVGDHHLVTCLRCWWRRFKYPNLITWS